MITQTEIELDAMMLDDRLSLVLDYYRENKEDILIRLPVPTTSCNRCNKDSFQNVGSVLNTGFELTAEYQKSVGDFNYTLTGNISTSKNEVMEVVVTIDLDIARITESESNLMNERIHKT